MGGVTPIEAARPRVLEFFAGIGLARMGLEAGGFRVAWANDYERSKLEMYRAHFGSGQSSHYVLADIAEVEAIALPRDTKLAWASSPCTDLSLAGGRAGLHGAASRTFWQFVRLIEELGEDRPEVLVLENVTGLATSHGGDDLTAAIRAFNRLGYSADIVVLDARRFLAQSRPRLFVIGARNPPADSSYETPLRPDSIQWVFNDPTLRTHRALLPDPPALLTEGFSATVEDVPLSSPLWWNATRTAAFVDSLSPIQLGRITDIQIQTTTTYRTAYRRTRRGVATWEIRSDDISGCLRTARGGSSKQAVVKAGEGELRVRWMTPTEYARLMGADGYDLTTTSPNKALYGFGDAVAVPVVKWLADNYLMPLVRERTLAHDRSESGSSASSRPRPNSLRELARVATAIH